MKSTTEVHDDPLSTAGSTNFDNSAADMPISGLGRTSRTTVTFESAEKQSALPIGEVVGRMGGRQVAIGLVVALVSASIGCGSGEDLDAELKDTGPIAASDAGGAETPDARSRAADGAIVDAAPSKPIAWITDPATHVNTLVGTTNVRKNFPGANVFPGADFPFGMVQWSPDTAPTRPSGGGYDYKDSKLLGFSLTHISGPGCSGALGDVPILPLTGVLPAGDLDAFTQPFTHIGEMGTAGYYAVTLGNPAILTELTATLHSAMARFTYPSTATANLLFKLRDSAAGNFGSATVAVVGKQEVSGSTSSGNFCGTGRPYVLYFDVVFDRPFTASNVIPAAGQAAPSFLFLTFDGSKNNVVQAKVGISFVSIENARDNWAAENPATQWSFDSIRNAAVTEWNETLGHIQIAGGTPSEQELFYTSLYHSLLHPNVASDSNGQYMGFDNKVHAVSGSQKNQYVNYSGWDTYRTQAQLSALVAPKASSDSAASMLNDASQNGGRLPRWSLEHGENGIMVGDPADGILAGYYAFGATDFDTATALKVMIREATVPNDMRPGLAEYESLGYVPDDIGYDQAGGISLEYNQADFALSQFAAALGDTANAARFLKRAQNWQTMFDPSVNMFIPKRKDGTFVPGVGPTSSHGLTEGDASQYRWVVAFNRQAQLTAMGGPAIANPALDAFFSNLDDYQGPSAFLTNEFELGSEFWANHTGQPWKTQEVANRIRTELFQDAPGFLDNNDDLGAMSSSLVWLMLGIYPDYPGSAVLSLNGPELGDARIALPSGKFLELHAEGASKATPYIQSLRVDGKPRDETWLDGSVIANGANLEFVMGSAPNEAWGKGGTDGPTTAGIDAVSGFVFATPNPLVLAPGASGDLTVVAVSARGDQAQTLAWTIAGAGVSAQAPSGSASLAAGARQTSHVKVTASAATGSSTLTFHLTSSLGATPPPFVLPVVVKK